MSVCSDCTHTRPIARCITNLIIGTVAQVSTALFVYIKDLTTDREIRYAVTSSAAGLVTLPITPQKFSEDHSYELRITRADAANINENIAVVIDGESNTCASLRFETIWTNNNVIATYTDQTLSV